MVKDFLKGNLRACQSLAPPKHKLQKTVSCGCVWRLWAELQTETVSLDLPFSKYKSTKV